MPKMPAGNLIGDGAASYRYDAQNRLVGFTAGSVVVSYGYDAEGRRSSRTEGGTTRHSLYALGQEIAEYAGTALVARHVPGPGLDEPLATVTGAPGSRVRVWYHADAQGSVIARSDGSGAVPAGERFSYTPYGAAGAGSGTAVAFRFVGRRLEPAVGLYDMRARVYAPGLGRFLQPDPIGTDGGINLYAYVRNDPLNYTDPAGTFLQAVGGAIIGASADAIIQLATTGTYNWQQGAAATVAGAVTGGLSAIIGRTSLQLGGRAVGNALAGSVTNAAQTEYLNASQGRNDSVQSAMILGAAFGFGGSVIGDKIAQAAHSYNYSKASVPERLLAGYMQGLNPNYAVPPPTVALANALGMVIGNMSGIIQNDMVPPIIKPAYGTSTASSARGGGSRK